MLLLKKLLIKINDLIGLDRDSIIKECGYESDDGKLIFEIKALKHLGRLLSQGRERLLIRWSWVRIPPDPPLLY